MEIAILVIKNKYQFSLWEESNIIYLPKVYSLSALKKYTWFLNWSLKTKSLWMASFSLGVEMVYPRRGKLASGQSSWTKIIANVNSTNWYINKQYIQLKFVQFISYLYTYQEDYFQIESSYPKPLSRTGCFNRQT